MAKPEVNTKPVDRELENLIQYGEKVAQNIEAQELAEWEAFATS